MFLFVFWLRNRPFIKYVRNQGNGGGSSKMCTASCVLCIICSPLSKSRSILPIAPVLLHCWHHFRPFCFAFVLICFWLNLIIQFKSEFNLSCTDLWKVSTEDGGHVISQMVILITKIERNCFYIIFSILLVCRRSDLFSVSLQITGYVMQTPLHITLNKLSFNSHCVSFYYITICPVLSACTIGIVSFI